MAQAGEAWGGEAVELSRMDVLMLQSILAAMRTEHGESFYPYSLDGDPGPFTMEGVRLFQAAVGHLEVTGRVNTETWGALLAAGQSLLETMAADDGDPRTWDDLPGYLVEDCLMLAHACVNHGVVYGAGRGAYDKANGRWIITQGPYGVGTGTYPTRKRGPAFVCSSWTYFAIMLLLRRWVEYEGAKAGAQPPLHVVLTSPEKVHRWKGSGPWLGLAPYFAPVSVDGSTRSRHAWAARGFMDMEEWWARFDADMRSVPQIALCEWASARKRFVHHTTLVVSDRLAGAVHFIDAGGWRDSAGVFSGTPMDIQTIRSMDEARAMGKAGCLRAWGVIPGQALNLALARPLQGLAVEVSKGVVRDVWGRGASVPAIG